MNIQEITRVAQDLLQILDGYSNPPRRETEISPVLSGLFVGRGWTTIREYWAPYSKKREGRIDFKIGTNNPVFIELAVRPPEGRSELYGSANKDELKKLCQITPTRARLRVLLLVDLHPQPFESERLKATYRHQNAGPGRIKRHPVRVIYVHRDTAYNFYWSPFA